MTSKLKITLTFTLLFFVFGLASGQTVDPGAVASRRAQLEAELAQLEAQIEQQRTLIQEKQREGTTFERDIAILNAEINKALLEIKARNLSISQLSEGIEEKASLISDYEKQVETEKTSLSELLRRINEMDSTTLVEIVLGYDTLSQFFEEFNSFESIQKELQISLDEIKNTQLRLTDEKMGLEDKKSEQLELRYIQELEKKKSEQKEAEKKTLLKVTKGQEKKYQEILTAQQKNAASIRSELFLLRGSAAIPFEKAVELANVTFKATGVRPAFLLGVISYESKLGANLGTGNWQTDLYNCYIKIGYKKSAEDQKTAFLAITSELGLNPDDMPVSKAPGYGCGGAMGPAQFMPATWQAYRDKIAQLTGHNPPNPWEPLDAFMAASLLLKDNGAAAGGYTAERRAALRYFAGSNWQKASYAFYGDDVMELATKYQNQIDIISQ